MARKIASALDGHSNPTVNGFPVRPTIHGTRTQKCQRIVFGTGVVYSDIPKHVVADLLSQIDVDAQEVGCRKISKRFIMQ